MTAIMAPPTEQSQQAVPTRRNPRVRVNFDLTPEAYEELKALAGDGTIAEVVRHAIGLEKLVRETSGNGGKILLADSDDQLRELVLC